MFDIDGAEAGEALDLRIVINWFDELRCLAPRK